MDAADTTGLLTRRLDELMGLVPDASARPSGRVTAFDGFLIEAIGVAASTGAMCEIEGEDGGVFDAEVIGFRAEKLLLMSLEAGRHVTPGARVTPVSHDPAIAVGDDFLGRVVDGRGRAIDGGPQPVGTERWPLRGRPRNPLDHISVSKPIDVGVRAINAALTLGCGQRVGIIAGSGVGKSVLLGMMSQFTKADIVVIGLIGERGREVSDFVAQHIGGESKARTIVVAVPANHSPVLRLRGAERATAMAEYYRAKGKSVLLILDSLTRVAHAQREIGLTLGEQPTAKGHPPSVFSLIPSLVERAGNDPGGGSITALYTVLADGGDVDGDPVVDSARAILDGHIVLSRSIAERGLYPAIDISKSISRVMQDIVPAEHQKAARRLKHLNAVHEESRDLVMLGAYRRGTNRDLDEAIARRSDFEAFMAQGQHERVDLASSRSALEAVVAPRT